MGQAARARESNAEAEHLRYEAEAQKNVFLEARSKLRRSTEELALRSDVAQLDFELARQQVQTVLLQLNNGTGDPTGTQPTPKDEQNARLQERQKFVDLLDAQMDLQKAQVQLMQQNGTLDNWLRLAVAMPTVP
jgi:hypothetical protein